MTMGVKELFTSLQEQLISSLKGGREALTHPGARGEASEKNWIEMLGAHLPSRYQINSAFVIDHTGAVSEQIDVVIYDRQYTPLLYNRHDQRFVPAESVYAVFEVKQDLTRQHIIYAGRKAASVRRLERTSAPIIHAGGRHGPRDLTPILAGILAYESSWRPPLGDPLIESLRELEAREQIDLGCAVSHGAFEAKYSDDGPPALERCDSSISLISFFFNLLSRLQQLGTVPAIDYARYLSTLRG